MSAPLRKQASHEEAELTFVPLGRGTVVVVVDSIDASTRLTLRLLPLQVTKSERQVMKPLYDRYRLVKQILCRASTIPVIVSVSSLLLPSPDPPQPPGRPAARRRTGSLILGSCRPCRGNQRRPCHRRFIHLPEALSPALAAQ